VHPGAMPWIEEVHKNVKRRAKVHPGRFIPSRDDNITVAGPTYLVGLPLESARVHPTTRSNNGDHDL